MAPKYPPKSSAQLPKKNIQVKFPDKFNDVLYTLFDPKII
jgi:hypothetical protein